MNRDQKATAIAEIAAHIDESQAIFAVDYRGISVPQVAELRAKLRPADATFKVVKNSLTERAADEAGAATLKDFLTGPTALTFIRGDVATAAKAIADYARATQLLPFKGGLMDGAVLDVDQLRALSRLPSREVLYGQLVGVVGSPVSGLVRTLNALLGGLAVALGQVREKMESGEIPAGAAIARGVEEPTAEAEAAAAEEPAVEEPHAEEESAAREEPSAQAEAASAEEPAAEEPQAAQEPAPEAEAPASEEPQTQEQQAEAATANQAEPEIGLARGDDNKADASTQQKPDAAADSTKED
jgi:large subunit ribosomal protein L10